LVFFVSADWTLLLAQVSICSASVRAGSDVGSGGRGVDGVPPPGTRGEPARAAARMRPCTDLVPRPLA
jgi:hypothetical protein